MTPGSSWVFEPTWTFDVQVCPDCTIEFVHEEGVTGSRCPSCAVGERKQFKWSYTPAKTAEAFPDGPPVRPDWLRAR
jgi:hypothetical protein